MKNLYSRLALVTSIVLVTGYLIVTAAWTSMSNVGTGDQLSATLWNTLLDNTRDLDTRIKSVGSVWQSATGGIAYTGGNVGIGTATPLVNTKLDVYGGRVRAMANNETYSFMAQYGAGAGQYYFGATNSASPDGVFSNSAGTERMRITDSGNVGIGTASPWQRLSVAGMIESTSGGMKFPDGTAQTTAFQWIMTIRQNNIGSFTLANNGSITYVASCLAWEVATWWWCQDGGYKDFYYWQPAWPTSYACGWYNTSGASRTYGGASVYVNCLK